MTFFNFHHMAEESRRRLKREQVELFKLLWRELEKEKVDIDRDFGISRNMACSHWGWDELSGCLTTTRYDPKIMGLLQKNHSMHVEENSRRKYFLLVMFRPLLEELDVQMTGEQRACYEYWQEELKKEKPELDDRFRNERKKAS